MNNEVIIREYDDDVVCVTHKGRTVCTREPIQVARLVQLAMRTPIVSELTSPRRRKVTIAPPTKAPTKKMSTVARVKAGL